MTESVLRSEMALRTAAAQAEYYTEWRESVPERQLLRAREIARSIGDKAYELKILWMLYGQAGNVGNYRQELLYAQLFEAAARGPTGTTPQFRCERILSRALGDLGQFALAQRHVEQALRSDRAAVPRVSLHAYEIDDWVAARAILARTLWLRGYPDDAKAAAEQCLADALQVGHEQSTCWAIAFNLCPVAIWRGDFDRAETLTSILLEHSQQVFQHYQEWGLLYRRFLDQAKSTPGQVDAPWHSDLKPEIPAQADLFATFGACAGPDPFARAQSDEAIWCGAELLRARAYRPVLSGDETARAAAEAMLVRSLGLAKRQDAKAWELRAATSLASLYLRSSRKSDARAVLEPTLNHFKQGHDTQDIQAAINVLSG